MIIQFFGKAAGFSECSEDAMTQAAVIPLNTNRILFADNVIIRSKSNSETPPIIRINRIKSNTQRRFVFSDDKSNALFPDCHIFAAAYFLYHHRNILISYSLRFFAPLRMTKKHTSFLSFRMPLLSFRSNEESIVEILRSALNDKKTHSE